MSEEPREIVPFAFVDFGATDEFRDFTPRPDTADEVEEVDPKGESALASAASPVQESTSEDVDIEEALVDAASGDLPPASLDPSKPTSSDKESTGKIEPPALAPPTPVLPASPTPSSPTKEKITPPAS